MKKVVVVAACRTPIAKIPGPFTEYDEVTLLAKCFNEVVKRAGIDPTIIDNSYTGCTFQTEKINIGRRAIIKAGLPGTIPGTTITRSCISSMEAMVQAYHDITGGNSDVVLAGGVEISSNAPFLMNFLRKVARIPAVCESVRKNGDFSAEQIQFYQDVPDYDTVVPEIEENETQLIAESFAKKFNISRQEVDLFAYSSVKKACEAEKKGYFKKEIVPISINRNGEESFVTQDQFINSERTLEDFEKQESFYVKNGVMTQFSSAPLGDGACAMLLMSESKAKELGINPLAVLRADAVVGMDSSRKGQSISCSVEKLLNRERLKPEDVDLWEINETFAPQMVHFQKYFHIPKEKFNVNGGSIALGLPVGASGLRICITLIYEMIERQAKNGIAAGCAGSGMAQCIWFSRE